MCSAPMADEEKVAQCRFGVATCGDLPSPNACLALDHARVAFDLGIPGRATANAGGFGMPVRAPMRARAREKSMRFMRSRGDNELLTTAHELPSVTDEDSPPESLKKQLAESIDKARSKLQQAPKAVFTCGDLPDLAETWACLRRGRRKFSNERMMQANCTPAFLKGLKTKCKKKFDCAETADTLEPSSESASDLEESSSGEEEEEEEALESGLGEDSEAEDAGEASDGEGAARGMGLSPGAASGEESEVESVGLEEDSEEEPDAGRNLPRWIPVRVPSSELRPVVEDLEEQQQQEMRGNLKRLIAARVLSSELERVAEEEETEALEEQCRAPERRAAADEQREQGKRPCELGLWHARSV
mmetsp:Transcript_103381/g.287865  ORF Transcript_103381/g.287865 Transcript_103381/m.287865 type:complete len:360 (+) Transcript_103381:22-1101(+)